MRRGGGEAAEPSEEIEGAGEEAEASDAEVIEEASCVAGSWVEDLLGRCRACDLADCGCEGPA